MRREILANRFTAKVADTYLAGPTAEGVRFRAATGDQPAEILVYDFIGADMWAEGVTAKGIISALADAGGGPLRVRVNSPGGDVFEGLAIYNALLGYTGGVDVVVDGVAASAASFIAMAGATITMQDASMMMIHNARTLAYGDKNAMAAKVETLGKVDATLAGIYVEKTGKSAEEIGAAMDAETWYTAQEAVDAGLATAAATPARKAGTKAEVTESVQAAAAAESVQAAAAAEPVQAAAEAPDADRAAARRRRLRLASAI